MAKRKCVNCGASSPSEAVDCQYCGSGLKEESVEVVPEPESIEVAENEKSTVKIGPKAGDEFDPHGVGCWIIFILLILLSFLGVG